MNINMMGFFCGTSYGLCALNIVKALYNLGHQVSVFPLALEQSDIPPQFHESLQVGLTNAQYWDVNAPCVSITHQNMMTLSAGKRRIGWPIFELDTFTPHELHHLASLDEIIVCSQWAKNVCVANGLKQPIHVVPLGVDTSIFYPRSKPRKPTDGPTVFLSVGKKEIRKLHDRLRLYFEKAFTPSDNVELWLVWGNRILDARKPKESADWTKHYQTGPMAEKIHLFEWLPSQTDVAEMMRRADCYIGLSRAEGWNLNLLEAMACGNTCIANEYSGHTEFAYGNRFLENKLVISGNIWNVPYRASEPAVDGTWFFGQGNWMAFEEPEEELVIKHMREYHDMVKDIGGWFNTEGVETAKRFSWENSARTLIEVLS